ncbi:MAG: hypothetical protein ABI183_10260, partial [Polyangiaceae bacterium]
IGRPPPGFRGDVADYVLGNFDSSEKAELGGVVEKAVAAATAIVKEGVNSAMNRLNAKAPPRNGPQDTTKAELRAGVQTKAELRAGVQTKAEPKKT